MPSQADQMCQKVRFPAPHSDHYYTSGLSSHLEDYDIHVLAKALRYTWNLRAGSQPNENLSALI